MIPYVFRKSKMYQNFLKYFLGLGVEPGIHISFAALKTSQQQLLPPTSSVCIWILNHLSLKMAKLPAYKLR